MRDNRSDSTKMHGATIRFVDFEFAVDSIWRTQNILFGNVGICLDNVVQPVL
jgi:hypothetical protein